MWDLETIIRMNNGGTLPQVKDLWKTKGWQRPNKPSFTTAEYEAKRSKKAKRAKSRKKHVD